MTTNKPKYYCGPNMLPEFVKKRLSGKFNESCRIHDEDYDADQIPRKEADNKFLASMLETSKSRRDRLVARTYYYLVKGAGWIFS